MNEEVLWSKSCMKIFHTKVHWTNEMNVHAESQVLLQFKNQSRSFWLHKKTKGSLSLNAIWVQFG